MLKGIRDSKIGALSKKRNILSIALGVSLIANLFLSLSVNRLVGGERIVLVPPVVSEDTWLDTNRASAAYLREMSQYLLFSSLNVTPQTVSSRRDLFLHYVHPSGYGDIKDQMLAEELIIKKKNISKMFNPMTYEIDDKALSVRAIGEVTTWVAKEKLSQEKMVFLMRFSLNNGRLQLVDFKEEKNEKHT